MFTRLPPDPQLKRVKLQNLALQSVQSDNEQLRVHMADLTKVNESLRAEKAELVLSLMSEH